VSNVIHPVNLWGCQPDARVVTVILPSMPVCLVLIVPLAILQAIGSQSIEVRIQASLMRAGAA
jgi:hypothetical protein